MRAYYGRIAATHRLATWSIWFFPCIFLAVLTAMSVVFETMFASLLVFFGVWGIAVVYGIVRLARSLQYSGGAIMFFVLCVVPGAYFTMGLSALIPLIAVYDQARESLKQAGYKVGFIGADMRQFDGKTLNDAE